MCIYLFIYHVYINKYIHIILYYLALVLKTLLVSRHICLKPFYERAKACV